MKVALVFLDESGATLGASKVPAEQLPESFAVATTLDIGPDKYEVVTAEPGTRADAMRTGTMTLTLRKAATHVDPKELLCSLPVIANELPGCAAPRGEAPVVTLHEDDWRQVELMSAASVLLAADDLAAVRKVIAEDRVGAGFRRLHLRGMVAPLAGARVGLDAVLAALGARADAVKGVTFAGEAGCVEDGFAAEGGGLVAYGRQRGGLVLELGFLRSSVESVIDARALAGWAAEQKLVLVDWCRGAAGAEFSSVWPVAGVAPGRVFLSLRS